jgi:hypothetical protein
MARDDADYLERRASAAIALAEHAACPAAAKAHYLMAAHYLMRLYPPSNDASVVGHGSGSTRPNTSV